MPMLASVAPDSLTATPAERLVPRSAILLVDPQEVL